MKKSALKLAIASTVFAAGSAMAASQGDIFVDLLIGNTANLNLTTSNIFLDGTAAAATTGGNTVTGSASGCAYSSTPGGFGVTITSLNGSNLIGTAGVVPYTYGYVAGANSIPSCGGVDNLTVNVSAFIPEAQATGTYSDVLTVVLSAL